MNPLEYAAGLTNANHAATQNDRNPQMTTDSSIPDTNLPGASGMNNGGIFGSALGHMLLLVFILAIILFGLWKLEGEPTPKASS